tara:strand:+ start:606 stop:1715 length:1110 start_codon:yes stop_codon:yes gene_type:complete
MANTLKFGAGNWATKEGSTLAYNDENGNFKPLPFDFTRASSATVVNKAGLIETVENGIPRIDFSNDANGALLLEPTRSNLTTYSEAFDNAYWTKSNTTVTSGFVSPDGTNNAFKLTSNNGGNIISRPSLTLNTTHTTSIYLKRVSGTGNVSIFKPNGNETVVTLTSEWQRFTDVNSVNPSNAYTGVRLYGLSDEVLIYGAQVEQGSYATSYIPTQGSAVTRVADTCNNGGNDQVINSTEGVLYLEGSFNELFRLGISENASSSNRVLIGQSSSSLSYIVTSASSPVVNNSVSGYQFNQNLKLAAKYKQNDFALWVNGIEVITVSSGNTPTALNSLDLKGQGLNAYGNIKDLRVYNTALTDAELQSLTTI